MYLHVQYIIACIPMYCSLVHYTKSSLCMYKIHPQVVFPFHVQVNYISTCTALYLQQHDLPHSYVWGGIADCIGRKPVLIACGLLLTVTSVMFGFSINFAMCVLARFLMGLCCGKSLTCGVVCIQVGLKHTRTENFGG